MTREKVLLCEVGVKQLRMWFVSGTGEFIKWRSVYKNAVHVEDPVAVDT